MQNRNSFILFFFFLVVTIPSLGALSSDDTHGEAKPMGKIKFKHASQIKASPWGIQIGTLDREHVKRAAAIGVKWTRLQATWRSIEKSEGKYDWVETDKAFSIALDNDITPFICLGGSNPLYCKEYQGATKLEKEIYGSTLLPPTVTTEALSAWLKFVRATINRYKANIKYWEVWNEPNHWAYWGAPPDGAEYGRLLFETAKVIKEVDPAAKVIAGALAGLDPQFTEKFLQQNTASLVDIITFHNYASVPEERIYKAMDTWAVINKYNPKLELWQGECGYPSHSSTRDYRGTSPWGPLIQAKWLLRQSFTDVFFCRTSMSNYFKLVHEGGRGEMPKRTSLTAIDSVVGFPDRNGSRVKSVGVNEKCLLENPSLKPKPGYYAYQNLCSIFDSRYTITNEKTQVSITDEGIFYGIGKEDDAFPSIPLVATFKSSNGSAFYAYWLPWHPMELVKEGHIDLTVEISLFQSPVLVDLLTGNVYPVSLMKENGKSVFKNIPLTDYPLVIMERKELEIE
jgi:hypothetical protein